MFSTPRPVYGYVPQYAIGSNNGYRYLTTSPYMEYNPKHKNNRIVIIMKQEQILSAEKEAVVAEGGIVVVNTMQESRLRATTDAESFLSSGLKASQSLVTSIRDASPTRQFVACCIRAKGSFENLLFQKYVGEMKKETFCDLLISNFSLANPNIGFSKANNKFLLEYVFLDFTYFIFNIQFKQYVGDG